MGYNRDFSQTYRQSIFLYSKLGPLGREANQFWDDYDKNGIYYLYFRE